jgi:hypothetical protein
MINLFTSRLSLAGFLLSFLISPEFTFALEAAQLEAIQNAAQAEYKVEWLRNRRTSQNVILVGETHVVSKARNKIALELVKQFPLIGIEGVRSVGLPKQVVSMGISKDCSFARKVGPFDGPIKLAREKIGRDYEILRSIIAEFRYEDATLKKALHRGFPITEEPALLLIPGIEQGTLVTELNFDNIMRKAEVFLSEVGVIELEYFSAIPKSLYELALTQESASDELIERSMSDRNSVMTHNILLTLESRPEDKTLLVLVGELHVDGIVTNLMAENFTKVSLSYNQYSFCNIM